jgi:predicted ferric reductase
MNGQFWWFMTRASGITAWLMLTASVIWGIVLSTKAFAKHRRPAWLFDLHRWLGGLTVLFVTIHIAALVADNYTHFGVKEIALPYASNWKPGAVALGVLGMWLLVAIELTSLAMKRLPKKVWRYVHMSSYVLFWLTSLHGAFAGTDRSRLLYQGTAVASLLAVAWATMYRIANRRPQRAARSAVA